MGWGIHGWTKVSCGPAMPDPYTPTGRAACGRLLPPWIPLIVRACQLPSAHMARGGQGLPKVSLGPAMPYPSTPYGRPPPETALQLFQGWPPVGRAAFGRLLPPWIPYAVRLCHRLTGSLRSSKQMKDPEAKGRWRRWR
jgi:hypothetical protein